MKKAGKMVEVGQNEDIIRVDKEQKGRVGLSQKKGGSKYLMDSSFDSGPTLTNILFLVSIAATWFEHPYTGSCGYGIYDDNQPVLDDAVFAMPDTFDDYDQGYCGRCYEIKCRPLMVVSDNGGTVQLDRMDACTDSSQSIVVRAVDTCPCVGNEAWCCTSSSKSSYGMPHFDLGVNTFSRLAEKGKGVIGLKWRPAPCPGTTQEQLQESNALGASPDVFINGTVGLGWSKTQHGDALRSMYTWNNSLKKEGDSIALCTSVEQYGGFDFSASPKDHIPSSLFNKAIGVEFWVQTGSTVAAFDGATSSSMPDFVFRLSNTLKAGCANDLSLSEGVTADVKDGWTRIFYPIEKFGCGTQAWSSGVEEVNRLQWENRNPGEQSICIKDVKIVL